MKIGGRIKSARIRCGMTQTELAEEVGTSKQNICKYEKGYVTAIPYDVFIKLVNALHVTADYLAGLDSDETTEYITTASNMKIEIMLPDVNGYELHVKNVPAGAVGQLCAALVECGRAWTELEIGDIVCGTVCSENDRDFGFAVLIYPNE